MVDTLKEIDNMLDSELPIKHTANLIEILNGLSNCDTIVLNMNIVEPYLFSTCFKI